MADYLSGMLQGFLQRKGDIEQQNIEQEKLAQQRETNLYSALLQSPDAEIRNMAVSGLLEGTRPKARATGLRGWIGERQASPTFQNLQRLLGTPQTVTEAQTTYHPASPGPASTPLSPGMLPGAMTPEGTALPQTPPQQQTTVPTTAGVSPNQSVRPGAPPISPNQPASAPTPGLGAPPAPSALSANDVLQASPGISGRPIVGPGGGGFVEGPPTPMTIMRQVQRPRQAFLGPIEQQQLQAQLPAQQLLAKGSAAYTLIKQHGGSDEEALRGLEYASGMLPRQMGYTGVGNILFSQLPPDEQERVRSQFPAVTDTTVLKTNMDRMGNRVYTPTSTASPGGTDLTEPGGLIDTIAPPGNTQFGDLNARTKAAVLAAQGRNDTAGVNKAIAAAQQERSTVETAYAKTHQPVNPQLTKYLADQVQQDFGNWKMVSNMEESVRNAVMAEMGARGITPNVITEGDRSMATAAKEALPLMEEVVPLARQMQQMGLMGPIGGRWREFMTGAFGEQLGKTPEQRALIGQFRSQTRALASLAARAHGGLRGAASVPMLEQFEQIMGSDHMDYATFLGAMKGAQRLMQTYAGMTPNPTGTVGAGATGPGAGPAATPPAGGPPPALKTVAPPNGPAGLFVGSDGQLHTGSPTGPIYKAGGGQ